MERPRSPLLKLFYRFHFRIPPYDKFILKDEQDEGYKKNIETKLNKIL